jgi:hypothetical protein
MVQDILNGTSRLGRLVGDGETTAVIVTTYEEHYLTATVTSINGVEYVTHIKFFNVFLSEHVRPAIHL